MSDFRPAGSELTNAELTWLAAASMVGLPSVSNELEVFRVNATGTGFELATISSGGGFTPLNTASTVDGSNTAFIFLTAIAQPTFIVSDGLEYAALNAAGANQWTWNSGTKTATLVTISPPTQSIFGIQ